MLLSWRYYLFGISRHYASLSPHSLGSNRGYRQKDDIPEAVFNQEMKKMKEHVGQSIDPEFEDDEIQQRETLQQLNHDFEKRGSAMNYAKRAKYLGFRGEKRTLTWDSIDKIRFLRQTHPEEWSISQLAASFEVSEMTIKKVLKSKYTPRSDTRKRQDMLALKNTGRADAERETPSFDTSIVLNTAKQTSAQTRQALDSNYVSSTNDSKIMRGIEKQTTGSLEVNVKSRSPRKVDEDSQEDVWDEEANFNLEDELEEAEAFSSLTRLDFLKVAEDKATPPKMIQKGREFYDSDGEFLFKI